MAIKRREIKMYIEKVMILCIQTSYRSARDHPFVFALVLFLLVLYISFPCLFAFLVSSSPVIVCTTLLLGLLLSYGEPNIPEIEKEDERTRDMPSEEIGGSFKHLYVKEDDNLMVEEHVEYRSHHEGIASMATERSNAGEDIYESTNQNEGTKKLDAIVATNSLDGEVNRENYNKEKVIQEKELHGQEIFKDRYLYVENPGVTGVGKIISSVGIADRQETEDLMLENGEPALDHHFDSSLGLPWQSIDNDHASSDTDSDRAESSSPDASMADIIPMLDELHPLLDSEHPQHVSISKSDVDTEGSSSDHEPDDNSVDEEGENHAEEEDEEAQEEKDDGMEAAVKWTEDDQKNVMDLGSSELERNRRLESLIAKRRARKNLAFLMERNLIDLDASDSFLSRDDLSRFRVQVPPISAPRRNPFDIPYDSEETMDLLPIPGSAPSSLLPRRNPFDIFYDEQEQNSSLTGETWGHQDFVSAPHREVLYRRNETFSLGTRELQQERPHSRLKSYFVAENMDSEGSSTFHRQFSDKSESKVSYIPESDTVSSVTDQEYKRELEKQEFQQETELTPLGKHDADVVDNGSHTTEEAELVDSEVKNVHLTDDLEIDVDTDLIIQESDQVVEDSGAVEEDIRDGIHLNPPISDYEKLDVVEQRYDQPHSSSSDEDKKDSETTFSEQSLNLEQTRNLRESDYSTRVDQVHDYKVAEPIYDSSPLVAGKSFSELSTVDEAETDAVGAGQGDNTSSSVKFHMQKEVSEVGSSPSSIEQNAATPIGDFVSVNASVEEMASVSSGPFTSGQSLISIEENESRSREITDISKYDDVIIGKSASQEGSIHTISCMIDELAAADSINHTNSSSLTAQSRVADPIVVNMSHYTEIEETVEITQSSYSNISLLSDDSVSSELQKPVPFMEKYSLSSDHITVKDSQLSNLDLASISDDSREDFKQQDKDPGVTNEELKVNVSDIEQQASFFWKSREDISHMDDCDKLFHKPEVSTSDLLSAGHIHDGSLTGLQLISLTESITEIKASSGSDLSASRDGIITEVLTKYEDGSLKMVDSSDEESDEIHPVVLETDEMDESLPTAMDGTADFHIEELSSNQRGSLSMFQMDSQSEDISSASRSSFVHDNTQLQFSEDRSTQYDDISSNQPSKGSFIESQEVSSAVSLPRVIESEIGSSYSSSGNFEQIVYNPKVHVFEASLVQEVNSASNQPLQKTMVPSVSDSKIGEPMTAKLNLQLREMVAAESNTTDSELLVVEARSVEDIHSTFKQISEELLEKSLYHEVGSQNLHESKSQNLQGTGDHDSKQMQSDLHVEAKSIEDIDMAFSQLSHSTSKKAPKATGAIDGYLEVCASEEQLETKVVEVQSADEISFAFKEPVASETSTSMEQIGEKSGAEIVGDVPASKTLTSKKTQKKHKRRNSVSSSSSSSSSSDSDFYENKKDD
ncbi:unnamed protein product [Musa acuminata subsp. malaccensis]|uniref:(wild Malaysian banana) hypothetical protein n=1 Tax=Musa acuminata subsp. malaccensis TaxID=214687 RepID=A0A804JYT6_MUSAM|nr:PREDICTED: uncharacterized protein LOC103992472 isoform X1 [Musa acuminata subsp. malaccensis]CAG1857499.1 unnamed protein product [Musa acuminata subsp. malaccensis]